MANVLFTRKNASEIPNVPITDGQLIFDTSGNGKMYLDNGTERLEMGGALTVDATLSKTSTNPVQNKAVAGVMLDTLSDINNVTSKGFLADALAIKELNSSLIANEKQFQFAYDADKGSYGYLIDGTFKSFNDATALYEALQYSGLVTPDMTYEQMLQVLRETYPEITNMDLVVSTASSDWIADSGISVSKSASSIQVTGSVNGGAYYGKKINCSDASVLEYAFSINHGGAWVYLDIGSDPNSFSVVAQTDKSTSGRVSLKNYKNTGCYIRLRLGPNGSRTLTATKLNITG